VSLLVPCFSDHLLLHLRTSVCVSPPSTTVRVKPINREPEAAPPPEHTSTLIALRLMKLFRDPGFVPLIPAVFHFALLVLLFVLTGHLLFSPFPRFRRVDLHFRALAHESPFDFTLLFVGFGCSKLTLWSSSSQFFPGT